MDLADPELVLILNIEDNKFCNDCHRKNPRWCSINNAVLLCPSCARKHQRYNKNISKVKSLEGELWTKEEVKKLYIGGNQRFNKVLLSYNIPLSNENVEYKYHTKIAAYYRNLLDEELGKKIINLIKPSLKEGIELINKEDYDKLNQYYPSQDNVLQNNNNDMNNNNSNDLNQSDFSKVLNIPENKNNYSNPFASDIPQNKNVYANPFASDFNNNNYNNINNYSNSNNYNNRNNFNNNNSEVNFEKQLNDFADQMSNVFSNISQKAQSIDYNKQLRDAGEFIKEKKEKIENSETFKGFMSALSTGIENFVKKTEDFFNESLSNNNLGNSNNNMPQRNRYNNRNQNQPQFEGQRINNNNYNDNYSNNNNNNNNLSQNQSQNDNDDNFNLFINTGTPYGGSDFPQMIEYSNNPTNLNIEGEVKSNDNNVENLDDNNDKQNDNKNNDNQNDNKNNDIKNNNNENIENNQ